MAESLDALRLVVGVGFLLYATMLDLRTRRVANGVWVALAVVGGLVLIMDLAVVGNIQWPYLGASVILIPVIYGLWYAHILAGGADAKALMALAILAPYPAAWQLGDSMLPIWQSPVPPAVVALGNAVVIFVLVPVGLFIFNLARGHVHVPTMFLGYKMPLELAARRFVWIVDTIDEQGRLSRVLFPSRRTRAVQKRNIDVLRERGFKTVWVTPKVPFMLPLLGGYASAFFLGDVLFHTVALVLGR